MRAAVRERLVMVTSEFPGVTHINYLDLPLWLWRQYVAVVNARAEEARKHG